MNKKSILIMAGGTGGHVFPGIALAEELQNRGFNIEWLGTQRGIEARVVPGANICLHTLNITGVRGRGLLSLLVAPLKILSAIVGAFKIMGKVNPVLVVGFGGYASGPGGIAAKLRGLPLVIHEQNAIAGTTNRYLAKIANRVATAFPNALPRGEFIGNPIRKNILSIIGDRPASKERINILVMGGSRGARAINQVVPEAVKQLTLNVSVLHQTGMEDKQSTQAAYGDCAKQIEVVAFIDDMTEALSWADIVVCRSGASTVTELAQAGLPAIFIPFPYAIDDHQTENAHYLVDSGAALICQQKELSAEKLRDMLTELCVDEKKRVDMGSKAKIMARPHATEHLANICEELING